MVFTADGKMTREPLGKTGVKGEGTWKLSHGRLLHDLEGLEGELLPRGQRRRQQVVDHQGTTAVGSWSK